MRTQAHLSADSGAIHTMRHKHKYVKCGLWHIFICGLRHRFFCRLWCNLNVKMRHKRMYLNVDSGTFFYFQIYWNSLFLKVVIFDLTSFLCNIMACCSSWSLPLTQLSVVYLTDLSVRKKRTFQKIDWANIRSTTVC